MWAHDNKSPTADVIAAFDNQDDADEALLQLRLAGFRDKQIGYTGRLANGHTTDLMERDHSFAGATLGGIVGAALGVAIAPGLARLMSPPTGPSDLFYLEITCAVFGALFISFVGGWIGMSMHRRGVDAPAPAPGDGPFVLAVNSGNARDRAWSILHQHGHDLASGPIMQPGAM